MKILYFGYGAYRNRSKVEQVIAHPRPEEIGGIAEGYRLAYQDLSQIPQKASDILRNVWGDNFKAYTLKRENGIVSGVVYTITEEDLVKIKEWEFDGLWRDIIEIEIKTSDGFVVKAFTDMAKPDQQVAGYADGLLYNEFAFIIKQEKENIRDQEYYTQQQLEKIRANLAAIKSNG